jgi:hypothetical protein
VPSHKANKEKYVDLYVKRLYFYWILTQIGTCKKKPSIQNFMQILLVGAEFFHAGAGLDSRLLKTKITQKSIHEKKKL